MRPIFPATLITLASLTVPATAQVTGYEWTYLRDIQPNPLSTVMVLTLGVPETDDILIGARCVLSSGPLMTFNIAADIGTLAPETDVDFTITPEGLNSSTVPATVRIDEVVGGVFIDRVPTDPFNFALAAAPVLNWNIVGQAPLSVDVSVNQHLVGRFLYECAHFGAQVPDPSGQTLFPNRMPPGMGDMADMSGMAPVSPEPGALSCDAFGTTVSTGEGLTQVVTFVNESDGGRALTWIGPDGTVSDIGFLSQGDNLSFETMTSHVWMITDGPGNCIEMMRPSAGVGTYRITLPAPDFGAE